jgi:effector-binding domain-containing protein
VDRYFPELFGWLAARGIDAAGAPFIRYLQVDMANGLEIDVAAPVPSPLQPEGQISAEVLPAGRYVTLLHVGPYDGLMSANAALQKWAVQRGIRWQMTDDSRWGARVERYLTNPSDEPDRRRWETELAYLAVDD